MDFILPRDRSPVISAKVFHQSSSSGFVTILAAGSMLRISPDSFMTFIAKECIVDMYASSILLSLSSRCESSLPPSSFHLTRVSLILSCISLAAFSVKVSTSIRSVVRSRSEASSQAKRCESVWVFPVPAPALTTVSGLAEITASTCSGSPLRQRYAADKRSSLSGAIHVSLPVSFLSLFEVPLFSPADDDVLAEPAHG